MTEAATRAAAISSARGPEEKRQELTAAANAAVYELPDPTPDVEHPGGTLFFYADDSYLLMAGWVAREVSLEAGMRALGMLEPDTIPAALQHPHRDVRAAAIGYLREELTDSAAPALARTLAEG